MGINTGKVITGGLAAGVVMNVFDFVTNTYIMAERFKTEMDALNPALMPKMMETSTTITFVALDFVYGLLLVLTYAAIRPRFGAGVGTAIKTALLVWTIAGTTWYFTTAMGMISMGAFAMMSVISLVTFLAAAYVGAMLYKED
ncbi:MAG: hypothetical protein ABMA00_00180 [Gemmatimonas sp.]